MECATSVVLQLSHAADHFLRENFSPGPTHSHTKPFSPTCFLLWLPEEAPFCPQAESHWTHGTDNVRHFQTRHTGTLWKTVFPLVKSSDWKSSAGNTVAEQTVTVALWNNRTKEVQTNVLEFPLCYHPQQKFIFTCRSHRSQMGGLGIQGRV